MILEAVMLRVKPNLEDDFDILSQLKHIGKSLPPNFIFKLCGAGGFGTRDASLQCPF